MRMIKSRKMRWAGHVVCMGKIRNAYKILVWKLKGRRNFKDLDVGGRIILKWFLCK
jgi:hypothetical protein